MNAKLAALAYLAASTEAIARHNQRTWYHRTRCGTATCLAGYICMIDEGEDFDERQHGH